ncbi:MAG: ferrous iron transporter B [Chloroflexi bacterium]|nr:ferrous iron transporter B [Chloroflexota bacterium]
MISDRDAAGSPPTSASVLLVGKESVGKSALARALGHGNATSQNFRGTTVVCESYEAGGYTLVDAPGILRASDSETTRLALDALQGADRVLLVVQATHLDEDLDDLLPLVAGHRAVVAVTFWDRVEDHNPAREVLTRLSLSLGVPVIPVDARSASEDVARSLIDALADPGVVEHTSAPVRAGWRIEPRRTLLEYRLLGPVLASLLLLGPAVLAVLSANAVAGWLEALVEWLTGPASEPIAAWPAPLSDVLAGDYGFITMGPLLFVWAVPTVTVYALVNAAYKASGLVDRIGTALHPLLRPVGLHGRDVTRVMMGFGCNVPAVISTRSCAGCTRPTTVGAIAFGSACSYQLGATLAVFAATGRSGLIVPYLVILVLATLVYARLTSPAIARSPLNALVVEQRTFLARPAMGAVWREASGTVREFFQKALPIFFGIALVASLLAWAGALELAARELGPVMTLFNLPADSALPAILASVRKDGLLLLAEQGTVESMTAVQTLAAVFLAGLLLPCLVTAFTVARELGTRFALAMVVKQALAAVVVTLAVAWGGALVTEVV